MYFDKKKNNVVSMEPHKYDDKSAWKKENPQADIGYVRPSTPWARTVISSIGKKSATESPLKEWWKEQEKIKADAEKAKSNE